MINLTSFLWSLNAHCYGNLFFGANRWKLECPPSFCALAFHNGWEDRNMYCMYALAPPMTPLRHIKIWVNLRFSSPGVLHFKCAFLPGGLHAGFFHAFLVLTVTAESDVSFQFIRPFSLVTSHWPFTFQTGSFQDNKLSVFFRDRMPFLTLSLHWWEFDALTSAG